MKAKHIAALALAAGCFACEQTNERDSLVGAWRLISWEQPSATGEASYPYGRTPEGQIIYTANGQMSAQLMNPGGNLAGVTASGAQEIVGRMSENYFAYYGTFTLDPETQTVTHHVKGSLAPNWVGSEQPRQFEFLPDGRLQLIAVLGAQDQTSDFATGRQVLVWERIE